MADQKDGIYPDVADMAVQEVKDDQIPIDSKEALSTNDQEESMGRIMNLNRAANIAEFRNTQKNATNFIAISKSVAHLVRRLSPYLDLTFRSKMSFSADSGATKLMSDQRNFFETFMGIQAGTWLVLGIRGTKLKVPWSGNVKILVQINQVLSSKTLNEVLYVSELGINLFSIGAATENGLEANFRDNKNTFLSQKRIIISGERQENTLYQLN